MTSWSCGDRMFGCVKPLTLGLAVETLVRLPGSVTAASATAVKVAAPPAAARATTRFENLTCVPLSRLVRRRIRRDRREARPRCRAGGYRIGDRGVTARRDACPAW